MSDARGIDERSTDSEKDLLYRILKKYSARDKSLSAEEFIRQELQASNLFSKDEIEETVKTISNTISSNSNNYREIQAYKKKGLEPSKWLRDLFDKVTSNFSSEARSSLITSIKNSFNHENLEMASKMSGQEIKKLVQPLETNDFTEQNRNIIAENLMNEVKMNSNFKTIAMEKIITLMNNKEGEKNA